MAILNSGHFRSPAGQIHLLASEQGLTAVYFDAQEEAMSRRFPVARRGDFGRNPWLLRAEAFLSCYFAGDLYFAPEIPLDLHGTPFQRTVWEQLPRIEPGETSSYGQVAQWAGKPKASRAVGAAIGRNPLSILIPCHRAVGAAGQLTGYAGGLEVKRFLLDHESRHRGQAA